MLDTHVSNRNMLSVDEKTNILAVVSLFSEAQKTEKLLGFNEV